MAFKIGNIFKKAAEIGAKWIGTKIGGPVGGNFASKIVGSLLNKKPGGGDYQIEDTGVAPPNLSQFGNMATYRPGDAKGVPTSLKTMDGNDLTAYWDRKLMNAMGKDAQYKRTLT